MVTVEKAEHSASMVLTWLANHDDLISMFLAQTGANVEDLRQNAQSSEFLGFVLEFLLGQSDEVVLQCAEDLGLEAQGFLAMRAALPGGENWHWT